MKIISIGLYLPKTILDATLVNTQNTGEYLCAVQIATVGPTGERRWLLRGYMLSRFEHCNGRDRSDIRRTPQTMDRLLRARRKTIKCKSRFRLEVRDGEIVDVILIIISIPTRWAVPCSERDVMRRNSERSTYPENDNYSTNAYGIRCLPRVYIPTTRVWNIHFQYIFISGHLFLFYDCSIGVCLSFMIQLLSDFYYMYMVCKAHC